MNFDAGHLLAGIRDWVEQETPTDAPQAVSALMARVAAEAAAAGARCETIAGRDGMGDHLLLRSPWGGKAPGILVLSHLDTVHPLGTLARMPFGVEGDIARGPGIYDMKAGARLAFEAFCGFLRAGTRTPLPIAYLFNSDEEVGSPTSRDLIRRLAGNARYVLVTEPAREGGKVVTARKGAARFDIRLTGRAAHSGSRHQDGRSAIGEMAHQIIALHGMTDYASGVTVNVGVVSGGTRANVVAEEARMAVDMRLPTPAIAEEMVAKVLALAPHDPDVRIAVSGGLNRPPYEKTPAIAALFDKARAIAAEIGFDLQDLKTGGGSDGNFCADLAPVLDGLGADGKGGHSTDEQIYLRSLVPRARLLQGLMATLA